MSQQVGGSAAHCHSALRPSPLTLEALESHSIDADSVVAIFEVARADVCLVFPDRVLFVSFRNLKDVLVTTQPRPCAVIVKSVSRGQDAERCIRILHKSEAPLYDIRFPDTITAILKSASASAQKKQKVAPVSSPSLQDVFGPHKIRTIKVDSHVPHLPDIMINKASVTRTRSQDTSLKHSFFFVAFGRHGSGDTAEPLHVFTDVHADAARIHKSGELDCGSFVSEVLGLQVAEDVSRVCGAVIANDDVHLIHSCLLNILQISTVAVICFQRDHQWKADWYVRNESSEPVVAMLQQSCSLCSM